MAYLALKSHESLDNVKNVLNPKQLSKEAADKKICSINGSHLTSLSLIKPRIENLPTNVVVKPAHFTPKTTLIDKNNDSEIECLGIFPCNTESNVTIHKASYQKLGERKIKCLIKNPHELLLSKEKRLFDETKNVQQKSQPKTNVDLSLKSPVEMTVGDAENNYYQKITPNGNISDKNTSEVKSNFGANLKREVRYINLTAKNKSLNFELEKPHATLTQFISSNKQKNTNSVQTSTAKEISPRIANANIIKLPNTDLDSSTKSVQQKTTTIHPKQFDNLKQNSNNKVVIKGKTYSVKKISPKSQGEIIVNENQEIQEQPQKKNFVEQETQTDIYCWILKNGNLYTIDADEVNTINHTVVPVQTVQITSLLTETNNIREVKSPEENSAGHDFFKDYIDCRQNETTEKNIYPSMSAVNPNDFIDSCQTKFIKDQQSYKQYADKINLNNINNSFVYSDDNQIYDNIEIDKQSKINNSLKSYPTSVTKLVNKICEDIRSCQIQDACGNLPLHQAVIENNMNKLKSQCIILKTIGSNLNYLNSDEDTALMVAVKQAVEGNSSSYEAVSLLVQEGADQTIVDTEGYFPLLYAVKHGNLKLVNILLSAQDAHKVIEKFGHNGFAPLHLAAIGDMDEIIRILLISRANVNIKDRKSGRTPYFHAIEKGNKKAVTVLLAFKADAYEPNLAGQLPPVVKTTKSQQVVHSSPKICTSIAELDYLNKVENPKKFKSIISPCESSKKENLNKNRFSLQTQLEKMQNDKILKSSDFEPIKCLDGIGSIKSYKGTNESNPNSGSVKNNVISLSSEQPLSSKLLAQPKVFTLLKPNLIISKELFSEKSDKKSDLVIQKTIKGTRSIELRDRSSNIFNSTLHVPSKSAEGHTNEVKKMLPNIILSRNTTLNKQNSNKPSSILIKKDCVKKKTQKNTLANFFSRFDHETSNSAESNTNEITEKESDNDSNNKGSSCLTDNKCKAISSKPENSALQNTLNLYNSNINEQHDVAKTPNNSMDEIPIFCFGDPTNNLESSSLELNRIRPELMLVSEESPIQDASLKDQTTYSIMESSNLESVNIQNTNCTVVGMCNPTECLSETTECTIVDHSDEIEYCDLDVMNGKQVVSLDISNIEATSVIIGNCSYTSNNTISSKNETDTSEIIGSDNVQLTFNTYLDNVVDQSIDDSTFNNNTSNGDKTFDNITKVNRVGLKQKSIMGPRKRSSKNMLNETSTTCKIKGKRIKKL